MMENNKVDYYEVLGITDEEKKLTGDAFADVVKKKYKRLAVKYHPDKWVNGTEQEKKEAEEKFKQINEANMVLSDPQKRERYDLGDTSGFDFPDFGGFSPFEGMDIDDFSPFGHGFSFFGNRGQRKQVERGQDVQVDVYVTLEEILNGGSKDVKYQKNIPCSHCNGTGSSDGKEHVCEHCHGTGRITQTTRRGNMVMQNISACPYCGGTGKGGGTVDRCKYCGGSGVETVYETTRINIPYGIFDNAAIKIDGKGCEPRTKGGVNGDMIVVFHELPHSTFKRDGNNLLMDLELDLDEALCGCEKEIKTLDGHKVKMQIPELTEYGKVFRLAGKGIPYARTNSTGDLYVTIKYKKLNSITEKQKKLIKEFYGR